MNQIPDRQNEPKQIERLAAQRQLYRAAKSLQVVSTILAVPFPIIWPLLTIWNSDTAPYAAMFGIVSSCADVAFLSPSITNLKRQAALIQEDFDCYVLSLKWHDLHSGKPPSAEQIRRAAKKFDVKGGERNSLKNWYPVKVGQLSLELGRIICQRACCLWDGDLRRRYAAITIWTLAIITVTSLTIGMGAGFALKEFVQAVLAPLLPLFLFGIKQSTESLSAAKRAESLCQHAEDLWKKAATGMQIDELEVGSRDLQCEIFSHRQSAPLTFEWLYNLLRRDQEELMNVGAEALVDEALALKSQPASF